MHFTTKDLLQQFNTAWLPGNLQAAMLRLDRIHPLVQGNKWFKLQRNLEAAGSRPVVTFGGPWSNHLHATAAACKLLGLPVTGIVRGEAPAVPSQTLRDAAGLGMHILHVPRELYDALKKGDVTRAPLDLLPLLESACIIPEGGGNEAGAEGCEDILELGDFSPYTHVLCAVGTGTTLAGLINGAGKRGLRAEIWGISALKGAFSLDDEIRGLLKGEMVEWEVLHDYHEGGFAKVTPELITEMNDFFRQTCIPTDRVYTGKMVLAFRKLAAAGEFPPGSKILLIHTGGLQGNASLPQGSLHF
ncbi:1-aminocyclopropane-1-carboxylate deaminase/D-cysteine desulfhydrase [Chitinophaga deserti]|uniref:1-aminocyclopropane-1-carboxylate deaminase/D-cysteine desulfhydrase n=1 Tax=Chitinophaga deserti TaxID=2164099 RepID=UPI000D6A95CE|nr:pyridoxal-phosphate dependent enzyme [Chitinophaga deserti]